MHAVQPMRKRPYSLISTIITQTLILYIIVLLPLIWFSRRLAKPLRELTAAAQRYLPGQSKMLVEAGPPDTRQLIAAFNAMQARVDAMLDEKDVMLGAIGHDLRTPLAALRVRVESVESDEEREQMVRGIEDIDRTLDDILSLARVGRAGEHLEPTDLAALVETIVSEFDDLGEPVSVTASARAVVPLRETMIRRALRNLISNAVKYGGKAELSVEQFADRLAVHIDDGGPGLPDAQIERMFEPFQRAEASRNRATGGSGLGLTLARAIARDHGGEVRLSNRAGGGLRASLILPLAGSDRASV